MTKPRSRAEADEYFAIIPESVLYAEISANAVRIYGVLRRHADQGTGQAHPSRRRLAALARCSVNTLDRALGELVSIGALTVESRYEDGQTSNLYTVSSVGVPLPRNGEGGLPNSDAPPSPKTTHQEPEPLNQSQPNQIVPYGTKARDPYFEILFFLESAGVPYSTEAGRSLTATARGLISAKAKEIRATGIAPDELNAAIQSWPDVFPNATCTPAAVAKHLERLRAAAAGRIARGERVYETDLQATIRRMRERDEQEASG